MLRNTLAAIAGIAAAGFIAAPIASADITDLTNTDVIQSAELPPTPSKPAPILYATGDHTPQPYGILARDCKPVMGTWTENDGFVEDPNGHDVAYSSGGSLRDGGSLRSNGYKNGLH